MCFSNCCNVFCVNGSKDCLVEAKFYLVSRWKFGMLSHWLADCRQCSVLYDDWQVWLFSVFSIWRRCDSMLDIILTGYIWLWYLWLVSNGYFWNNLWSVYFKTTGWEIKFHYVYSCSFLSCVCIPICRRNMVPLKL